MERSDRTSSRRPGELPTDAAGPVAALPLRVGCAMWANRDWIGRFLPDGTRPADLLREYQACFGAVEGNTTFYGLPRPATVAHWAGDAGPHFRFLCKLPRTITHERRLRDAGPELAEVLDRLAPLAERLGPTAVQLPASFGPDQLPLLDRFLAGLPGDWPWSVEVRHPDFFAGGAFEAALDELLHRQGVNRVILDSRALFSLPPRDELERVTQQAKPRLPVRPAAPARRPVVRFIGHLDEAVSAAHWTRWFGPVLRWLKQGYEPTLFFHTADNRDAPTQAARFWRELAEHAAGTVAGPLAPRGDPDPPVQTLDI